MRIFNSLFVDKVSFDKFALLPKMNVRMLFVVVVSMGGDGLDIDWRAAKPCQLNSYNSGKLAVSSGISDDCKE